MRLVAFAIAVAVFLPVLRADDFDTELARLDGEDPIARQSAELKLEQLATPAHLPRLVAFYKTCKGSATNHVIDVVQKVGGPPAQQALRLMLRGRTDYGAFTAAAALERAGDPSGYDYLIEKVRSDATPEAFRLTLVMYLSSMGTAGTAALFELAASTRLAPALRAGALEGLCYAAAGPGDDKIKPTLAGELPAELQLAADLYRYSRGDREAAQRLDARALTAAIPLGQLYIWLHAIEKLRDTERKAALVHLGQSAALGTVVVQVMHALGKIGAREEALRVARLHLDATDDYIKRESRKLVAETGGPSARADLVARLGTGSITDRVEAAELLLRLDDYSGERVITDALAGADLEGRRVACRAAAGLVARSVPPLLARALRDADETVRRNAFASLQTLVRRLLPYRNLDWNKVGYDPTGDPAARDATSAKLERWLETALE